jgi:hypothetical protein
MMLHGNQKQRAEYTLMIYPAPASFQADTIYKSHEKLCCVCSRMGLQFSV